MARKKQNSIGVLLRITAFRRLWIAFSVSSLGDWLGLLATTAFAAYLTKDNSSLVQGAAVSGVLVTRLAPDLIFAPIAGALVDRFDRRKIAMICDTIAGLMYLSIAIVGSLTWLLIAQFLVEAVGLFSNPAKQALWVNIVPRERLAVANQLNYVSVYGMVPVAAVVFALLATAAQFFGVTPDIDASDSNALISVTSAVAITIALVLDSITYFIAAAVMFFTRKLIPAFLDDEKVPKSVFSLVKEGIGFIKNSRVMRAIYVGILGAFGAGGFVVGVAQSYVATMGGGNAGYGILFGTVFTGLALGMLIGPKILPAVPRQMVFTLGIGMAGVSLFVMSLIQDFVGAAAMSVVMGLFGGVAWITGFTLIGHEVADRLRGRVFSFVTSSVRLALLATIAVGPVLANGIGFHTLEVGSFSMRWSGPGVVLAVSGLLVIGVAIFAGRQVGGLRGELVRKIIRRIVTARQHRLLDAEESQPGLLVSVVGARTGDVDRYAGAIVGHLADAGWIVEDVDADPGPAREGDSQADALAVMADLATLAAQRLWPAVEAGTVVVCRHYGDAAIVRFGALASLTEQRMIRLADWATAELRPDVVVLVDAPAPDHHAADRAGDGDAAGESGGPSADPDDGPGDRAGAVDDPATAAAVAAYRDLAAAAPERYVTVPPLGSGEQLPATVTEHLAVVVRQHSPRRADPVDAAESAPESADTIATGTADEIATGTTAEVAAEALAAEAAGVAAAADGTLAADRRSEDLQ